MQNSTKNGRPGHRYAWDNVAIRLVLVVLEFFCRRNPTFTREGGGLAKSSKLGLFKCDKFQAAFEFKFLETQ